MRKKLLFLLALLCTVAQGAWANGVKWYVNYGVYSHDATDLTGNSGAILDSYDVCWQLIYAGANNAIDPVDLDEAAYGYVSGDDVVLATRVLSKGNSGIFDNYLYTDEIDGTASSLPDSYSEGNYVYIRIYESQSPNAGTYYYESELVQLNANTEKIAFGPNDSGIKANKRIPCLSTYYVDASGTRHDVTATVLTGSEISLPAGWYVVTGNVTYTSTVNISDDAHLILADGCNMTVTKDPGYGIRANNLTIYGQGGETEGSLTASVRANNITINGGKITAVGTKEEAKDDWFFYKPIYAEEDITINGGQITATATNDQAIYSYKGDICINGGQITATASGYAIKAETDGGGEGGPGTKGHVTINGGKLDLNGNQGGIYACSDITLGLTNASDFIKASSYIGTVKTATGKHFVGYTPAATQNDTDKAFAYIAGGHTFTSAELTAIAGKKLAPNPDGLTYLDWDDTAKELVSKNTANDTYLDGTETKPYTNNDFVYVLQGGGETILPGGWYVAKGEVSYTGQLQFNDSNHLNGDTHLILADGCNMTVTDEYAIWGFASNLTIYGQSTGSNIGRLTTTSSRTGIDANSLTINGGVISATATGDGKFAISASNEDVTINGGQVTATGIFALNVTINGGIVSATGNNGIMAEGTYVNGTITLGWTNNTDYIYASSYGFDGNGTVSIMAGQAFTDGEGNFYSGTIDKVNDAYAIDGKTLRPAYIITYHLNDGTNNANNPAFFAAGNAAIDLAAPTRVGYDFGGWYDNDGLTGTALTTIAANSTANVELWAKWTAHDLIHHAAVAATCTTAGNDEYWECTVCGKYFSDDAGTIEIVADSWVIPGGHTLTEHPAVAATCTAAGSSAYWECSVCGKYFSDDAGTAEITENSWVIGALGHDVVNGECTRCHRVSTAYKDATGAGKSEWAMPLNNTMTTLTSGWYVVNSDVTYTSTVYINGDVHLILADGHNMTVSINPGYGIGSYYGDEADLTIYGQGGETEGSLTASVDVNNITINGGIITAVGTYEEGDKDWYFYKPIYAREDITINGGKITATATNDHAIYSDKGDICINGGQITATAGSNAIYAETGGGGEGGPGPKGHVTINGGKLELNGNNRGIHAISDITLGWTNKTDYIYASSYHSSNGTVSIKTGQAFADGDGNPYTGTIDEVNNVCAINGKTLRPAYIITYDLAGGTVATANPTTYSELSAAITLNNPTRTGYVFAGWTGTGLTEPTMTVTIASGSTGNRTYTATWAFVLADGTAYNKTSDETVDVATYRKTLGSERKDLHQAWLVPFDYTLTAADLEKFSFYKINMIANSPSPSQEASNAMWVFLTRLDAGAVLHANMPYVYKPKEAVTNYEFTTLNAMLKAKETDVLITMMTAEDTYTVYGTYENTTATTADPFYYVGIDGNISYGDNVTVGPQRWIIRKTSKFGNTPAYVREMHFYDGEDSADGIDEIDNGKLTIDNEAEADWYTLDGRKLNGKPTEAGLYIVGGRKVLIK